MANAAQWYAAAWAGLHRIRGNPPAAAKSSGVYPPSSRAAPHNVGERGIAARSVNTGHRRAVGGWLAVLGVVSLTACVAATDSTTAQDSELPTSTSSSTEAPVPPQADTDMTGGSTGSSGGPQFVCDNADAFDAAYCPYEPGDYCGWYAPVEQFEEGLQPRTILPGFNEVEAMCIKPASEACVACIRSQCEGAEEFLSMSCGGFRCVDVLFSARQVVSVGDASACMAHYACARQVAAVPFPLGGTSPCEDRCSGTREARYVEQILAVSTGCPG